MEREEFRRLQRAHDKSIKNKNKQPLYEWGIQFEQTLLHKLDEKYKKDFDKQIKSSIEYFLIAICYALHFSEETHLDSDKLNIFIDDLNATVDMFSTGEYNPDDYRNELRDDGVILRSLEGFKEENK